jgi:hypothetical protein
MPFRDDPWDDGWDGPTDEDLEENFRVELDKLIAKGTHDNECEAGCGRKHGDFVPDPEAAGCWACAECWEGEVETMDRVSAELAAEDRAERQLGRVSEPACVEHWEVRR